MDHLNQYKMDHRLHRHEEDTDDRCIWGDPDPDSLQRTDHKEIRPRKHDTGHSYTDTAVKEDWSLLMDAHADSDISLPSPLKPVACPQNKITANKTSSKSIGREFDTREPDMDIFVQRGNNEYGTEVLFEDVVSQYVSVDDGAVAYPMPFFTSPKKPQWQRQSRKDEELELYEDVHHKIGRGRKNDVSFGEGLPGQSFNYEDVRATVILPPTPRRTRESSMCRDRDCNLRADPDSNGFCLVHSRELQGMFAEENRTTSVRNERPRRFYTELMDKEDRMTPTPPKYHIEPPGESPRPIEGRSAGSWSTESQTQKRTYATSPPGNSLTIQDEPKRQMKTQKTQTRNVGHQPARKQAPAAPAPAPARPAHRTPAPASSPDETIEQEISEAELERDYADMVNNIIAVSKIATKKCRQPKCDNFGNEKSNWLCNGCYKNMLKRQQGVSSVKQQEVQTPVSREDQQKIMQAQAMAGAGSRAPNKYSTQTRPAAREKTSPTEEIPDQDMRGSRASNKYSTQTRPASQVKTSPAEETPDQDMRGSRASNKYNPQTRLVAREKTSPTEEIPDQDMRGSRAPNKYHTQTRPAAREKTSPTEEIPDQDMRGSRAPNKYNTQTRLVAREKTSPTEEIPEQDMRGSRAPNKYSTQTRPAAQVKTSPTEGTPDQDMRKLRTQAPHQCKIYGCRNYASKAGYCNACFTRLG